jgi:hypothetical protein
MNRLHHGILVGGQDAKQHVLYFLFSSQAGPLFFIGHGFAMSNTMTRRTDFRMRRGTGNHQDSDRFQTSNFVDLLKSLDQQW